MKTLKDHIESLEYILEMMSMRDGFREKVLQIKRQASKITGQPSVLLKEVLEYLKSLETDNVNNTGGSVTLIKKGENSEEDSEIENS